MTPMTTRDAFYEGLFVDAQGDVWRQDTDVHPDSEAVFRLVMLAGVAVSPDLPAKRYTAAEIGEQCGKGDCGGLWLYGSDGCPEVRTRRGAAPAAAAPVDSERLGSLALGAIVVVLACIVVAVIAIGLARMVGIL